METKISKSIDDLLPTVIVLVGNITNERPSKDSTKTLKGTRLFRDNSKVYLSSIQNAYAITDPKFSRFSVKVVGQHRASRKWIESWVRASYITNWRIQDVHKPGAVQRLWEAKWPGFGLLKDEFLIGEDRNSIERINEFLNTIIGRKYNQQLKQYPKSSDISTDLPN
jgi:hypothetical protein